LDEKDTEKLKAWRDFLQEEVPVEIAKAILRVGGHK
jgi:hypothetical protein